jgi:hypothetical protein
MEMEMIMTVPETLLENLHMSVLPVVTLSEQSQQKWENTGESTAHASYQSPMSPVIVTFSDLSDGKRSGSGEISTKTLAGKGPNLSSPGSKSNRSFETTWKVEFLMKKETDSEGSEEEFYDCLGKSLT